MKNNLIINIIIFILMVITSIIFLPYLPSKLPISVNSSNSYTYASKYLVVFILPLVNLIFDVISYKKMGLSLKNIIISIIIFLVNLSFLLVFKKQ